MTPNHEQRPIIESQAKRLLVNSGAGVGKTATLILYALARPTQNMLYVAYNKAIQLEASAKFPLNVECRTMHSLAFFVAKRLFGATVNVKLGNVRAYEVSQRFGMSNGMASAALATVTKWMGSADPEIALIHVPEVEMEIDQLEQVVVHAKSIWKAMLAPKELQIKMPHDGYLKVYQLGKPVMASYKKKFDVILLDEYQDSNPLTLDLVMRQPTSLVYVGDIHQSIYGFRGAVDALKYIEADETYYLKNSYRFGQPIADVANALLGQFYM